MTIEEIIEQLVRRVVQQELAAHAAKPTPQQVTIAEYAATRSISPSTVREAIRDGRLPAMRIGRAVRVPADVEVGAPVRVANTDSVRARAERILGLTGRR